MSGRQFCMRILFPHALASGTAFCSPRSRGAASKKKQCCVGADWDEVAGSGVVCGGGECVVVVGWVRM